MPDREARRVSSRPDLVLAPECRGSNVARRNSAAWRPLGGRRRPTAGGRAMGTATPRPSHLDNHRGHAAGHFEEEEELTALRDENKQLRELVIQLSKLVIRNVLEHK